MKVSFREQGNTRIVDVAGAVDLDAAPLLRQHLFEALRQAPKVALNLAAISFIETSGIAVLLEALLEKKNYLLLPLLVRLENILLPLVHPNRMLFSNLLKNRSLLLPKAIPICSY